VGQRGTHFYKRYGSGIFLLKKPQAPTYEALEERECYLRGTAISNDVSLGRGGFLSYSARVARIRQKMRKMRLEDGVSQNIQNWIIGCKGKSDCRV